MTYTDFIHQKSQLGEDHGFDPLWMPDFLYPFQQHLVEWATRKGCCAAFRAFAKRRGMTLETWRHVGGDEG